MTTHAPPIFWITAVLVVLTVGELILSTRKGDFPSKTFWILALVSGVFIIVGYRATT